MSSLGNCPQSFIGVPVVVLNLAYNSCNLSLASIDCCWHNDATYKFTGSNIFAYMKVSQRKILIVFAIIVQTLPGKIGRTHKTSFEVVRHTRAGLNHDPRLQRR